MYFSELFRRVGLPEDRFPPLGQRLFARHAERNLWSRVRERTLETLEELRRRGFRLAVISNADGRVEALLEQVGLRSPFEFVIDSQVVGLEKPDPRIFRLGLERAGGWRDTAVVLPEGSYSCAITGTGFEGGPVPAARLFETYPVALLVKEEA